MYDTLITGGTVVDGSGEPRRTADVAIKDGVIAEIGRITAPARETIDADGAIVSPGFVDVHSHYDGQFLWDDRLDPSFSHGVTTVIAGNCGVGFAPVGEHRRELIEIMEGVEEIPGIVLDEGLDWNWRSFPDYLDRLAQRAYTMDVASHLPHAPLRVFVMGERALRHEPATAEDLEAMSGLVREAMAAGAVGVSTSRLLEHISSRGENVPGTFAQDDELLALAGAMGESGRGVFQGIMKGTVGGIVLAALTREERMVEHGRLEAVARASGRPVIYNLVEFATDPDDFRMMVQASAEAASRGLDIRPQILARGLGMIQSLDTDNIFLLKATYREIAHLPRPERARAMRDPARRAAILDQPDDETAYADKPAVLMVMRAHRQYLPEAYVLTSPLDYEPGPDRKVGALAAAAGKSAEAFIYDHYAQGQGENFSVTFAMNYVHGTLDHVYDLLGSDRVVSGLADGGAHVKMICDACGPTFQIAFWTRERTRGPRLPLERIIRKLTSEPAALYGMDDRGLIAVGRRADLNVFDHQALSLTNPHMTHDLPSGAGRLVQGSSGYLATLVTGVTTRRHDEETGARPGRLVRSGALR
jgi:N-acyl-D-aspartate/D-glutamate deacylase